MEGKPPHADGKRIQDRVRELEAKQVEREVEVERAQREINELKAKVGEGQAEVKGMKREVKEQKTKVGEGQEEVERLKREVNELKAKVGEGQAEVKGLKREVEEQKTKVGEGQDEVKGLKREVEEQKSEVGKGQVEVKGLQREVIELEAKLAGREDEAGRMKVAMTELEAQAGSARELETRVAGQQRDQERLVGVVRKLADVMPPQATHQEASTPLSLLTILSLPTKLESLDACLVQVSSTEATVEKLDHMVDELETMLKSQKEQLQQFDEGSKLQEAQIEELSKQAAKVSELGQREEEAKRLLRDMEEARREEQATLGEEVDALKRVVMEQKGQLEGYAQKEGLMADLQTERSKREVEAAAQHQDSVDKVQQLEARLEAARLQEQEAVGRTKEGVARQGCRRDEQVQRSRGAGCKGRERERGSEAGVQ